MADPSGPMNESPPRVSIVLTTYNRADLLPRAVDSCLRQTFADLELIVVDDASSDSTPRVLEELANCDPRVRWLRQPVNGGQSRAINRGHAACRGQYCTWTTDDNLYKPQAIATMVHWLEGRAGASIVYADYENIALDGRVLTAVRLPDEFPDSLFTMPGACFLYRREVFERIGDYDPAIATCADLDYWIRARRSFAFIHIPEVLYQNAVHPGAVTSARHTQMCLEVGSILARYAPSRREARERKGRWYKEASRHEQGLGHHWRAVGYTVRAGLCRPGNFAGVGIAALEAAYLSLPQPLRAGWRALKAALRPRDRDGRSPPQAPASAHVTDHSQSTNTIP